MPIIRFTRRFPAFFESIITMSPLFGALSRLSEISVKGTFISYANLLTQILYQSSRVGCIEAPEIELRSAIALLKKTIQVRIKKNCLLSFQTRATRDQMKNFD